MILKNKTQNNFTMISNTILRDKRLKLMDRGLLCTLCSLPDEWNFSVNGMTGIVKDGKSAISQCLKRLEGIGYIKKTVIHGKQGKFETQIEINIDNCVDSNEPLPIYGNGKTVTDNPSRKNRNRKTVTENHPQYNTDNIHTDDNNTEDDKSIILSRSGEANHTDLEIERMKDKDKLELFISSTKKRVEYSRLIKSVDSNEFKYVDLLITIIAAELSDASNKNIKVAGVYIEGSYAVSHLLNYKYEEIFAVAKNLNASGIPFDKPKSYYITALDNQLKLNKPEVYAKLDEDET